MKSILWNSYHDYKIKKETFTYWSLIVLRKYKLFIFAHKTDEFLQFEELFTCTSNGLSPNTKSH